MKFEQELTALRPQLLAWAFRITRNTIAAEDLLQETYLRALRAKDQFQPGTNLHGWLSTIMLNAHRSQQRKNRLDFLPPEHLSFSGRNEQETMEARLDLGRALTAMASLPEEMRSILELAVLSECSHREMSERIGVPEGTVKSRLHRARRILRSSVYNESLP